MRNIAHELDTELTRRILRHINEEKSPNHTPQPMFIVGRRGAGKSTLVNSLLEALKDNDMSQRARVFDGKQFFNSCDIILAIHTINENYGCVAEPAANNNEAQRCIVIIDDFDYFLKRSSTDDQYRLRNYLSNESAPLLIATVTEVDDSLADYRAPFFEGVRLIYIPPLDLSIVKSLDLPAETRRRVLDLLSYLPPTVSSLKLASDIVAVSESDENDLQELLNREAPSYRVRMEGLPVNSQKILYALALSPEAMTLAELRGTTGLSAGTLSTYLRLLLKSGYIKKTVTNKRGVPYEICDILFKLWISTPNS